MNTNNCFGNMDYSPLAPTDTLNVKVSPSIAGALTGGAIATVTKGPIAAASALGVGIPSIMVKDALEGTPSFSASITGHHGETFGHFEIP